MGTHLPCPSSPTLHTMAPSTPLAEHRLHNPHSLPSPTIPTLENGKLWHCTSLHNMDWAMASVESCLCARHPLGCTSCLERTLGPTAIFMVLGCGMPSMEPSGILVSLQVPQDPRSSSRIDWGEGVGPNRRHFGADRHMRHGTHCIQGRAPSTMLHGTMILLHFN